MMIETTVWHDNFIDLTIDKFSQSVANIPVSLSVILSVILIVGVFMFVYVHHSMNLNFL